MQLTNATIFGGESYVNRKTARAGFDVCVFYQQELASENSF